MITEEKLKEAQDTIARWFIEQNNKTIQKPITVLDLTVYSGEQQFRLFNFFTFWGKDEQPKIIYEEKNDE